MKWSQVYATCDGWMYLIEIVDEHTEIARLVEVLMTVANDLSAKQKKTRLPKEVIWSIVCKPSLLDKPGATFAWIFQSVLTASIVEPVIDALRNLFPERRFISEGIGCHYAIDQGALPVVVWAKDGAHLVHFDHSFLQWASEKWRMMRLQNVGDELDPYLLTTVSEKLRAWGLLELMKPTDNI